MVLTDDVDVVFGEKNDSISLQSKTGSKKQVLNFQV